MGGGRGVQGAGEKGGRVWGLGCRGVWVEGGQGVGKGGLGSGFRLKTVYRGERGEGGSGKGGKGVGLREGRV